MSSQVPGRSKEGLHPSIARLSITLHIASTRHAMRLPIICPSRQTCRSRNQSNPPISRKLPAHKSPRSRWRTFLRLVRTMKTLWLLPRSVIWNTSKRTVFMIVLVVAVFSFGLIDLSLRATIDHHALTSCTFCTLLARTCIPTEYPWCLDSGPYDFGWSWKHSMTDEQQTILRYHRTSVPSQ